MGGFCGGEMNLTLGAIIVAILAIIAGLWAALRSSRKGGEARVEARVAKEASETQRRMDAAGTASAHTQPDVEDALDKGTF